MTVKISMDQVIGNDLPSQTPSRNDFARVSCKDCTFLQQKVLFSCILQDLAGILQEYACKVLVKFLQDSCKILQNTRKRAFLQFLQSTFARWFLTTGTQLYIRMINLKDKCVHSLLVYSNPRPYPPVALIDQSL